MTDPDRQVLLVRHAETAWSASGRHTGRTDIPLTASGRDRARKLAARLSGFQFARVFSSPLARARETCELAGLGLRAELCEGLVEWDYGDYEGRTTAEIRGERPDWWLWRDGCPGGEDAAAVGRRTDILLAELLDVAGDAAVFGHGHALRILAARWLELEAEQGSRFALSTASVSVLGFERETRVLWRWNATDEPGRALDSGR